MKIIVVSINILKFLGDKIAYFHVYDRGTNGGWVGV